MSLGYRDLILTFTIDPDFSSPSYDRIPTILSTSTNFSVQDKNPKLFELENLYRESSHKAI